jgi:hypothetical protein
MRERIASYVKEIEDLKAEKHALTADWIRALDEIRELREERYRHHDGEAPVILGIDPGLSGAVAFLDDEVAGHHRHARCEVTRNGKNKREVSPALIADAIAGKGITRAVLEVGCPPCRGQGVSSTFSFGRSTGVGKAYWRPTRYPLPW